MEKLKRIPTPRCTRFVFRFVILHLRNVPSMHERKVLRDTRKTTHVNGVKEVLRPRQLELDVVCQHRFLIAFDLSLCVVFVL